jgi:hypothetical protein
MTDYQTYIAVSPGKPLVEISRAMNVVPDDDRPRRRSGIRSRRHAARNYSLGRDVLISK